MNLLSPGGREDKSLCVFRGSALGCACVCYRVGLAGSIPARAEDFSSRDSSQAKASCLKGERWILRELATCVSAR